LIFKEYHFYILDDKKHDFKFVQHCFKLHWSHIVQNDYAPTSHWVWFDGCASQFKSTKPWFFVSKYPNMTNGCKTTWNFFGSGHGKGLHDGDGVVIKRLIRKEQLYVNGAKLQNVKEFVQFLHEHLSNRL
jgi:hypothetical protein